MVQESTTKASTIKITRLPNSTWEIQTYDKSGKKVITYTKENPFKKVK